MKTVKLTQKMLKMHPADLIIKLGAVNNARTAVFPQHVYFSKEDYKTLKKNLIDYAKKKNPLSPPRLTSYSVNMDMLNYGPSQKLKEAIRPGYALVDFDAIESENETKTN